MGNGWITIVGNGMMMNSYCGSFPHSLLGTTKIEINPATKTETFVSSWTHVRYQATCSWGAKQPSTVFRFHAGVCLKTKYIPEFDVWSSLSSGTYMGAHPHFQRDPYPPSITPTRRKAKVVTPSELGDPIQKKTAWWLGHPSEKY